MMKNIIETIMSRPAECWVASISKLSEWVIKTHSGEMTRIPGQPWVEKTYRQYGGNVVESYDGNKAIITDFLESYDGDYEVAYVDYDDDPRFHETVARKVNGEWL
ncbi:hypothetical protein [Pasteurella multocida]|uniref:hypothetical protein n=1 Tax=Pasteurella multocida TaxID=747 RepID=UPI00397A29EB